MKEEGYIYSIIISSDILTKDVLKELEDFKKKKIFIPSSTLIKGGYDIFGYKLTNDSAM